ncbi:hypothetical protein HG536_0H03460 [Torulaspora globosa]|uniref:Uncharacterized protein n=1 Tax=Torulaspora globosa TaxID=48254 RepID=A0A7G3ZN85_9SACH|nr:uncharacterized protein HG536_0H03460 [Torulaspora globosa]QLL34971.1 hypothetical protein HG536_0H03460 [Torulaspora globosa]
MTGSVDIEGLARAFDEMIKDRKIPSPKNQAIFNEICKTIVTSQLKPLLEFVDILLEKFMYPRTESDSLATLLSSQHADTLQRSRSGSFEVFDLGHPRVLEIIMVRQKIVELRKTGKQGWKITEYGSKVLRKLNQIYLLLVHLLQVLSDHIEAPLNALFYRNIIIQSISHFQIAFETFKSLDFIIHALLRNLQKSGTTDSIIFSVDDSLLLKIKDFSANSLVWYESLMIESTALREYLLVETKIFETGDEQDLSKKGIDSYALKVIYDSKFESFLERRKARLNISNRRIF